MAGQCPPPALQGARCGETGGARTAPGPCAASTRCVTTDSRVQQCTWSVAGALRPAGRRGPALPSPTSLVSLAWRHRPGVMLPPAPGLWGTPLTCAAEGPLSFPAPFLLSADTAQLPGATCSTDMRLLPGRREGLRHLFSRQPGKSAPSPPESPGAPASGHTPPAPRVEPPGQRSGLGRELRHTASGTPLRQAPRPEAAPAHTRARSSCSAKSFLRAKGRRPPHTPHRWSHWSPQSHPERPQSLLHKLTGIDVQTPALFLGGQLVCPLGRATVLTFGQIAIWMSL